MIDQLLILHLVPKDEFPGPDGEMVPGYEPDPAEVAQWVHDAMTDLTKHDERIGWRLRAVITTAPLSELAANWLAQAEIDQARAAQLGASSPGGNQLSGHVSAQRICARELRKAAGL